jgi:hypothetical protein
VIAFIAIFFGVPETAGKNFNMEKKGKMVKNLKVKTFGKRSGESSFPTVGFTALSKDDSKGSFCILDEDDGDMDDRDIELGMMKKVDNNNENEDQNEDEKNGKVIKKNINQDNKNISETPCILEKSITNNINDSSCIIIVEERPRNFNEMITNSKIQFLAVFYSFFSFSVMFVDECFPLWAVTSIQKGGLSWNTGQVGSALVGVGKSIYLIKLLICLYLFKFSFVSLTLFSVFTGAIIYYSSLSNLRHNTFLNSCLSTSFRCCTNNISVYHL